MGRKVLLVDDHLVVKAGVSIILNSEIDDLEISYSKDYFETIRSINATEFDLIILAINIPGGKSTEMVSEIKAVLPDVKILIFSAHEEESYALRYIYAGADGYLNKLSGQDKIVEAVKSIFTTGKFLTPEIIKKLHHNITNKEPINPFDKLSTRERQITEMLVKGDGNLEIANKLGIKLSTVSTYKLRLFEKLKINNLVELIDKYTLFID